MAKSVIALCIILAVIAAGAVGSFIYTNSIIERYEAKLEKVIKTPVPDELKEIEKSWEEDKGRLMFLSNHRDIEEVSEALIRSYHYAQNGRDDMAKQEIDLAVFLLKELIEREKISFENIF